MDISFFDSGVESFFVTVVEATSFDSLSTCLWCLGDVTSAECGSISLTRVDLRDGKGVLRLSIVLFCVLSSDLTVILGSLWGL